MESTLETVQMYKTSDGKTFESKDEAIKHQIELNKPKIYLVEICYGSYPQIEKAFLTKNGAEKYKKELYEKEYNSDSSISVNIIERELGE